MSQIEQLQKLIDESKRIVFFGGAGVSTESGIPDFRSTDGLYHQKYDYPPETILSHTFFMKRTEEFYRFYRDKMLYLDAKPNAAHLKLAELEEAGKLTAVVTQNIDGLHQRAGSRNVIELHGTTLKHYCTACKAVMPNEQVKALRGQIPRCEKCNHIVRPDVVLYEEPLNQSVIEEAIDAISLADLLIIGGTSLAVYPAANFIRYFKGENIVLINRDETRYDGMATLVFRESIGEVLESVLLSLE